MSATVIATRTLRGLDAAGSVAIASQQVELLSTGQLRFVRGGNTYLLDVSQDRALAQLLAQILGETINGVATPAGAVPAVFFGK
jgi:hypothetical protein